MCHYDSFSTWSLFGTRFFVFLVSGLTLYTCVRTLASWKKTTHLTSKPLWYFTTFWSSILLTITAFVLPRCSVNPVIWEIPFVALYGGAFTWTIAGLLWIVCSAQRSLNRIHIEVSDYLDKIESTLESVPPEENGL